MFVGKKAKKDNKKMQKLQMQITTDIDKGMRRMKRAWKKI
jgi:hypothetical protein